MSDSSRAQTQQSISYVPNPISYIDQMVTFQCISLLQNIFEKGAFTIHNILLLVLVLSFDGIRKWFAKGFEQINIFTNINTWLTNMKNAKYLRRQHVIEQEKQELKLMSPECIQMDFKPTTTFWEGVLASNKSYGNTEVSYTKTRDKTLTQENIYEYHLKETYKNIMFINDDFEVYFNKPINVTKSVVNGHVKIEKIEVVQSNSDLLLNSCVNNVKSFSDLLPFPQFAKLFRNLIEKREAVNIGDMRQRIQEHIDNDTGNIVTYINRIKTLHCGFFVNMLHGYSIQPSVRYDKNINMSYSSPMMDLWLNMIIELHKKYPKWDIVLSFYELYYICCMVNDVLIDNKFNIDKIFTHKAKILFGCNIIDTLQKFKNSPYPINGYVYAGKDIRDLILCAIPDAKEVKSYLESMFFPELQSQSRNSTLSDMSNNMNDNTITIYGDMNAWISYVQYVTSMTTKTNIDTNNNKESQIYILKVVDETVNDTTPNPAFEEWETYVETLKNTCTSPNTSSNLVPPPPSKTITTTRIVTKVVTEHVNNVYKDMSNLYLRKDDKRRLLNCLLQFKENKKLLKELGIPNKLGIMLYGEPGTGKSSSIHAIASFLKKNIYYIQLNEIKTNAQLRMLFNHVTKNCADGGIIVMEDIDAMTSIVHKRMHTSDSISFQHNNTNNSDDDSDSVKSDKLSSVSSSSTYSSTSELTLEFFLNILQGSLTSDESIFITTTNHIEKLDPAFYRDGRFDVKIEMKAADHDQMNDIYERFFSRSIPEHIIQKIPEYKFTPATLISKFREYLLEPNTDDMIILDSFMYT